MDEELERGLVKNGGMAAEEWREGWKELDGFLEGEREGDWK